VIDMKVIAIMVDQFCHCCYFAIVINVTANIKSHDAFFLSPLLLLPSLLLPPLPLLLVTFSFVIAAITSTFFLSSSVLS